MQREFSKRTGELDYESENDSSLDDYFDNLYKKYSLAEDKYLDFLTALNQAGIRVRDDNLRTREEFIMRVDPELTRERQRYVVSLV